MFIIMVPDSSLHTVITDGKTLMTYIKGNRRRRVRFFFYYNDIYTMANLKRRIITSTKYRKATITLFGYPTKYKYQQLLIIKECGKATPFLQKILNVVKEAFLKKL